LKQITDKDVFFCSAASRYFKEPLAGTAANSSVFILIEHCNPFPAKVGEAHFDKAWLQGIQKLAKSLKGKVLLIRNKKTNFRDCRIIFVDCKKCAYFTIQLPIEQVATVRLADYIHSESTEWETDPFFVICTNGKKDKCCAKFGYPVFKFFEAFNTDVQVWESSHVGGDRFAANVVALPFGIYYGHVVVEDVGHIMVRTLLRKIYKNKYRGLSRRSFFEQSVECYVREYLQNYDIDFDISMKLLHHEEDRYTVGVKTTSNFHCEVVLLKERIDYPHLLTCKSRAPETIVKYRLLELKPFDVI
jgi:Uncharacterized protein conserved in bacteria containing thioredoxin-like domain